MVMIVATKTTNSIEFGAYRNNARGFLDLSKFETQNVLGSAQVAHAEPTAPA
jgi:hypothetical protein